MEQDNIKMYNGYVYMIYNNFDDNVYIGETIQTVEKRFKQHIQESNNPKSKAFNFKISKALRKYGYSNFFVKELEKISGEDKIKVKKEIQLLEIKYIKEYNSFENGYNSDEGGLGGKCQSKEIRERLSQIKKNDPNTNKRLEIARSFRHIEKPTDVYNYCTGKLIQSFNSAKEAAKFLNLEGTDITKLCKQKTNYRTYNNIKITCRYKGEEFCPPYTIQVYTDDGKLNENFVFAKDASEKYKVDNSSIIRCCKGKVKSAGTYKGKKLRWKYYNGTSK